MKILLTIKTAYVALAVVALVFGGSYAYLNSHPQSNTIEKNAPKIEVPIPKAEEEQLRPVPGPAPPPQMPQVNWAPSPNPLPRVDSARISLTPKEAGINLTSLATLTPQVITKEVLRDCPAACGSSKKGIFKEGGSYAINFDVNLSKVAVLEWIAIEGGAKRLNLTYADCFLFDFIERKIPLAPRKGNVYGFSCIFGDPAKIDLWKEGDEVKVRFGFITVENVPRLAVSEQVIAVVRRAF